MASVFFLGGFLFEPTLQRYPENKGHPECFPRIIAYGFTAPYYLSSE